jgi:hypothetical protein
MQRARQVVLIAPMGEPPNDIERETYKHLTGSHDADPGEMVETFLAVVPRRCGKSRRPRSCRSTGENDPKRSCALVRDQRSIPTG